MNGRCPGVYSMHPDGTAVRDLTWTVRSEPFSPTSRAKTAPDGHLISYIGQCGKEEKPGADLCVMSRNGQDERIVATSGLTVVDSRHGATWSPDGKRLAFTRAAPSSTADDKATSVHVIGVDGTGETTLVEHAHAPAWSPDGSRIAVVSDREGTNKIFLVDPDGGGFVRLTDGPKDEDPDWAPDGSRIVFDSERAGKPLLHNADEDPTLSLPVGIGGRDIYTVRADGGDVVRLDRGSPPTTPIRRGPRTAVASPLPATATARSRFTS